MRSTNHRLAGAMATITLAATVCIAGYWEFEQVDSGSIGSYVAIDKMSDGATWLAYVNRDSAIRLAHKDTAWEYEDLDTAKVRPDLRDPPLTWPPFSMDIGPGNVVGVVGPGRLAEHRDSGWSVEGIPPMFAGGIVLGYDSACRPAVTFADSRLDGCFGQKVDSTWDTAVLCTPMASMWGGVPLSPLLAPKRQLRAD
jgi:hypothetical protein